MSDSKLSLKRPSGQEDEEDLLKLQQEFLSAKTVPSAKFKRVTREKESHESCKPGLGTSKPTTNLPSKSDDSPMIIDFTDNNTDLPVLLAITENVVNASDARMPGITKESFPKSFKLSDDITSGSDERHGKVPAKRRSLFAQQMRRNQILTTHHPLVALPVQDSDTQLPLPTVGEKMIVETMDFHEENLAKMANMSEEEIRQYQLQLLEQLSPEIINFIKSRKKDSGETTRNTSARSTSRTEPFNLGNSTGLPVNNQRSPIVNSQNAELDFPIDPEVAKMWPHMDKLELDKLAWMSQLLLPKPLDSKTGQTARFDFHGFLLTREEDISVQQGLHHHGQEPEVAGYTIEELFHLSRSSFSAQRIVTLQTLAHIFHNCHLGLFDECLEVRLFPQLLDAGLVYLLRCALDDSQMALASAALHALHALLVSPTDEVCLDRMFPWNLGFISPLLTPKEKMIEVGEEEKIEEMPDSEIVTADVIQGLVRMDVLPRLRYILEVIRPDDQTVINHVLEIMIRIARHSLQAASQIMDCPRLMQTIFTNFLPVQWIPSEASTRSAYGTPKPLALKLLRTLSAAGKHIAARLVHNTNLTSALNVYLACELRNDAVSLVRFEALRTWRVLLSYGLAAYNWIDLYSILLGHLQHCQGLSLSESSKGDLQYASLLLCTLQGLLPIAGTLESAKLRKDLFWHHVEGLYGLSCCLAQKWIQEVISSGFTDIVESQSALTAVLSFISLFLELEVKQPGINAALVCERVKNLYQQSLLPLLNSKEFSNIASTTNKSLILLEVSRSGKERNSDSLPSLGASLWGGRGMALRDDAIIPFCVALLQLLHQVDRMHCLCDQAAPLLFKHFGLFMKGFVALSQPQKSWFTTQEVYLLNHLVHFFLTKGQTMGELDVSLCHQVALVLPSLTYPGNSYLVDELISYVMFHPILFKEDLGISVQLLSLEGDEHLLVSASGRSLETKESQVLGETMQHLPEIKDLYLRHLRSTSQHQQSRCRMKQEFEGVHSISFNCLLEATFFTSEWIFIPIASFYDSLKKVGTNARPEVDVSSIHCCLTWLYYLMVARTAYFKSLTGEFFITIACVFLLSDDLFLEPKIQGTLQWILKRFLILYPADRLRLEEIQRPTLFLTFYQELLQQFEGSSYGDPLFCTTVLVPLQQRYTAFFRKLFLTEHSSALRMLTTPLDQMLVPLDNYLHPLENDVPLLMSYLQLLQSGLLTSCPILYTMAIHHLHHYILTSSEQPHAKKLLETVWRYRKQESVAAILLYKNVDARMGVIIFSTLSPERKELLKNLGISKTDL